VYALQMHVSSAAVFSGVMLQRCSVVLCCMAPPQVWLRVPRCGALYFCISRVVLLVILCLSHCRLRVGETEEALTDADRVLKTDGRYLKGLYAKAEALYFKGDFEFSLVYVVADLSARLPVFAPSPTH